jgi:hypothetical protein
MLHTDHDALDAYDPSVAVDVSQGDFVSIDDALSRSGRHVVFDRLMEVECSVCKESLGQEEEVRILRPCLHQVCGLILWIGSCTWLALLKIHYFIDNNQK